MRSRLFYGTNCVSQLVGRLIIIAPTYYVKKKCIFAFAKENDYEHRNDRNHPRVF